jgi:hypothetical protein
VNAWFFLPPISIDRACCVITMDEMDEMDATEVDGIASIGIGI